MTDAFVRLNPSIKPEKSPPWERIKGMAVSRSCEKSRLAGRFVDQRSVRDNKVFQPFVINLTASLPHCL